MSKTKIYEKIELTIIALCIIFVISIISYNKEIPMLTSANYEKTIGWGIKEKTIIYNQMLGVKINRY